MNRLTKNNGLMCMMDGDKPFMSRGCLMWGLFIYYLINGEAAYRVILEDRRSVGANWITVASMWSRWEQFHPSEPIYNWDAWRTFVDIAAEYNIRIEIAALVDTKPGLEWLDANGNVSGKFWPGMPNPNDRKNHIDRLFVTLGDKDNVTFILANQPRHRNQMLSIDELKNYVPPQVAAFPKILFARDNPNEGANPILPAGDYSGVCTKRNEPMFGVGEIGFSLWNYIFGNKSGEWNGTQDLVRLVEPYKINEGEVWDNPSYAKMLGRALHIKGCFGGNVWTHEDRMCEVYNKFKSHAIEFLGNIPEAPN